MAAYPQVPLQMAARIQQLEACNQQLQAQLRGMEDKLGRISHERDEYRKLYELVSLEAERMRRQLFGRKAEHVDPSQVQLALALLSPALGPSAPMTGPEPSTPPASTIATEEAAFESAGAVAPEGTAAAPEGTAAAPEDTAAAPEDTSTAVPPEPTSPAPQGPVAPERPQRGGRSKERKHTPHGRQKLPEHLPIERVELLPPEAQGDGAAALVRIGEEVSESVEWRPAGFVRLQIVRPKFARRDQPEHGIIIAELPDHPVPRCLAGPGLLAHVLVNKFADHLPLHRQEKIFERQGLHLARSTLCGWVGACAELLGFVVKAMANDALHAHCIAIDATGVLVQAKEQCRRGHFWVLVADQKHVLFRFTPRHTKEGPKEFLRGYNGYVQADAASVYEELFRSELAVEVGCWAHCRRGFFEAMSSDRERALVGLGFIRELFVLDAATRDLPPQARTEERRARAQPVLARFRAWLDSQLPLVLPKSPIAAAIGYALNQWAPLTRFLEDGRLLLDNNRSERQLRHQAVGRKNWLFVGSDEGAEWNATIVSLIASCGLHGIEPWSYLRDVLILLPRWPRERVLELAPASWQQTLEQTDARQRLAAAPWTRRPPPTG